MTALFPFVISPKGGKSETLLRFEDFLSLVEKHMGYDAAQWLREYTDHLQDEADFTAKRIETDLTNYESSLDSNRSAFLDIQAETEVIMEVLQGSRMDRRKIAHAVRQIGTIINNQI